MQVLIQKLPKSKIELRIEIPAEDFQGFIEKATLNLGENLEVKGFRRGNLPKEIIKKEIGSGEILAEAAELAIKENYPKAVLENKIEAISQPEIEILKLAPGNSLIFRAKTQVLPEINLPNYKKIASTIRRKEISVKEEEISQTLKWLQKSRAKFTLKNASCQKGDFIEIYFESPQIENGKKRKDEFILGEGHLIPGFEENLEGMKNGEEKEFSLTFPKDSKVENLANKEVNFKVKMNSVQTVEFPKISDQFAKNLGNFESLANLKENIREGLKMEKEKAESYRIRQRILEEINQNLDLEIPDILIEAEKNQMTKDLKEKVRQGLKISFEDYLNKIKKTEEEIKNSFLSEAQKKVKSFLVLNEIAKKEKIEVLEEEIKEEINIILKDYSDIEKAKQLDLEKLKEYTKEVIRNEKTLHFLEGFTKKL